MVPRGWERLFRGKGKKPPVSTAESLCRREDSILSAWEQGKLSEEEGGGGGLGSRAAEPLGSEHISRRWRGGGRREHQTKAEMLYERHCAGGLGQNMRQGRREAGQVIPSKLVESAHRGQAHP